MDWEDIEKILRPYYDFDATGIGGTATIVDQYRNANQLLGKLNDIKGLDHKSDVYKDYAGRFRNQKANAVLGGLTTGIGALGTIGSNMSRDMTIPDTTAYEEEARRLEDYGNINYGNFAQLSNDVANRPQIKPLSFQEVRGMNDWQKATSMVSSGLTGATAGAKIAGLPGAIAGTIGGVALGGIGVAAGDFNTDAFLTYRREAAKKANAISDLNLGAAGERILKKESDTSAVRVVEKGGKIPRASKPVNIFRYKAPSETIKREEVEDGIRIRIKR